MTEQVIIEFIADYASLDNAATVLEKTGAIDGKLAAGFKQTTAEMNKQADAAKNISSNIIPVKKNLEDVAGTIKNTSATFQQEVRLGIMDALKDAGVSMVEFKQRLGLIRGDSAFDKLNKDLETAKRNVAETAAQLEKLRRTGGVGTERFKQLEDQLVRNKHLLGQVADEFSKVSASAQATKAKTDSLGDSMAKLKTRLTAQKNDSPFDKLNRDLQLAKKNVLDTIAAMERLRRTGGADTEGFENLQETLKENEIILERLTDEYEAVTGAVKQHKAATVENAGAQEALRTKFRNLTQQMTLLKLEGKENTTQYQLLAQEAGKIKDAMGDVTTEIRTLAANSQLLEGVVGAAQGIAGGFAIAQGAAALFGDESEQMQETLLKVNAAMAILQGLQAVNNLLQKESAVSLLFINIQRKVQNAQILLENALQSQSVIVRGAATVAQRALNAAMAANPIGIVVVALAGLITIMGTYGRAAARATEQTSSLNAALKGGESAFTDRANAIKRQGDQMINSLENVGATDSRITEQEILNLKQLADVRKQRQKELLELDRLTADVEEKEKEGLRERLRELDNEILDDALLIGDLEAKARKQQSKEGLEDRRSAIEAELIMAKEGSTRQLALQKALIQASADVQLAADGLLAGQARLIRAKANEEKIQAEIDFNKRRLDIQIKGTENQLVNIREGSEEELQLRLKLVQLQTQAEINSIKLSQPERDAIAQAGFQQQLKLQKEFNEATRKLAIENQISRNTAELSAIQIGDEDRLLLTIANIELAAAIEIDAAKENATKIREINAKRDRDIKEARLQSINDVVAYEIALEQALSGASNRSLQRQLDDQDQILSAGTTAQQRVLERQLGVQKLGINELLRLIDQIAGRQLTGIDKQINALNDSFSAGLISLREYNLEYAKLEDEQARIVEEAEKKKRESVAKTNKLSKEQAEQLILDIISVASQVVGVLDSLFKLQSDKENQRISEQKARVQELRDAGAITEKEAIKRLKVLDGEERKIKREQANRDKALAIFNAVINTAQAITRALASANPFLAALAAALGAAQIAIIASRPVPKFSAGKKNTYQGWGEVGESGPEIIQREKTFYLTTKPTLTWLASKDVVYNPVETRTMLEKSTHTVNKEVMKPVNINAAKELDVDKIAKALAKELKKIPVNKFSFDRNGFNRSVQDGLDQINYFDKRYSFNGK